jgi:hypothetical protein
VTKLAASDARKTDDSVESGEQLGQNVRLRMDLLAFGEAMVRLTPPHAVSLIIGATHIRIG